MFTRLLASAAPRQRSTLSVMVSVGAHVLIGAGAIVLTAARPVVVQLEPQPIIYDDLNVEPRKVVLPSKAPRGASSTPSGAVPSAPSLTAVPVEIGTIVPSALPEIGVPLADPRGTWPRGGVPGGTGTGSGTTSTLGNGGPLTADEVEFGVALLPGSNAPRYPELLRNSGMEGRVQVRFVVDTLGRVEPGSVTVVEATHALFATAVREALLRQRFVPARVGTRAVRQLVQEPFEFTIRR